MTDAIDVKQKKRGRPATGRVFVGVRFLPDEIAAIDAYAASRGLSRSAAIRHLTRLALEGL